MQAHEQDWLNYTYIYKELGCVHMLWNMAKVITNLLQANRPKHSKSVYTIKLLRAFSLCFTLVRRSPPH